MYRQNSASVIRDAGCHGVKLPRHTLVMNHLKDLQKTFCDTTKLTTSGRAGAGSCETLRRYGLIFLGSTNFKSNRATFYPNP